MVCFKSSAAFSYVGGVWLFQARTRLRTVVEFHDDILYRSFDSNNCNVIQRKRRFFKNFPHTLVH